MSCLVVRDVRDSKTLDCLKSTVILTNAANGNAETAGKCRIGDRDVGGVGFRADTVIAVDNFPVGECDVVAVDGICAIRVFYSD